LISNQSLPFSLQYERERTDLLLVVEQMLDRETIPFYTFDIVAYDGDNQTGLLHVHITIDDVNDSPPKFDQTIYRISNLSEYTTINTIVTQIRAYDNDTGVNGELSYYLLNDESCFIIDEITGDVRVRCSLDYETKRTYRLNVEVRDHGEGSKTDFCTYVLWVQSKLRVRIRVDVIVFLYSYRILIDLVDENDHSPIIDFYPNDLPIVNQTLMLSLSESLPIHSLILSFAIVDRDSGDHGRVTWKLDRSSALPIELIRLTEYTGELRTKQLFDRESIDEYSFVLDAFDHGRPLSRTTSLPIHIVLQDENDHRPIFTFENVQAKISEHVSCNEQIGYEVYRVYAHDLDQGINGDIIYSLINNVHNQFRIDAHTGIIRAMKSFDRHEHSTYILHVRAEDRGN
jgi:hypothetical protein